MTEETEETIRSIDAVAGLIAEHQGEFGLIVTREKRRKPGNASEGDHYTSVAFFMGVLSGRVEANFLFEERFLRCSSVGLSSQCMELRRAPLARYVSDVKHAEFHVGDAAVLERFRSGGHLVLLAQMSRRLCREVYTGETNPAVIAGLKEIQGDFLSAFKRLLSLTGARSIQDELIRLHRLEKTLTDLLGATDISGQGIGQRILSDILES